MSVATISPYTASDGARIACYDWAAEPAHGGRVRGVVLLVHGLGEHAGRYDALAEELNRWGFSVRGYDQYGHGDSDGPRGTLPHERRLLDDLADLIGYTRAQHALAPLILLGHSMGGLVAARLLAEQPRLADGLVLSSPAFDAGLGFAQRALIALLLRLAPDWAVSNGLDPAALSHDPAVVAAYRQDPCVHDRISARLARFIDASGPIVQAAAAHWAVPTLLLYAGADRLVDPRGAQRFAAAAPPALVEAHRFETLYHETFNETHRQSVLLQLRRWLDARFP